MDTYTNKIFADSGLRWISGYWLPEGIHEKRVYVAQLARHAEERHAHNVIKCSNLGAWLERHEEGQKANKIAIERNYELVMQPVPHQPGHVYLNVFMIDPQP